MENTNTIPTPFGAVDVDADITRFVEAYQPVLMGASLCGALLGDLKALVRRCEVLNVVDANALLGAASRFLADVVPSGDGVVEGLDFWFTEARVAMWANAARLAGAERRTVSNISGRLKRLVRVQLGMPARIRVRGELDVLAAPLVATELSDLIDACIASGGAATRGLVAAIGTGVVGVPAEGAAIVTSGRSISLILVCGRTYSVVGPIAEMVADLAELGATVTSGDWDALRHAAARVDVHFNSVRARQTFRALAFSSSDSVANAIGVFQLTSDAVEGTWPHLRRSDSLDEELVHVMLRDLARAPRLWAGTVRVISPSSEVTTGNVPMPSGKISAAEARRRTEARKALAETPEPLAATHAAALGSYVPQIRDKGKWIRVQAVHHEVMIRSRIKGYDSFRKHLRIVAAYLMWRDANGEPIEISSAFTFAAIDRYYLQGMAEKEDRTRNDYRSRLRNLAERVNPGLDAPPKIATVGHVSVRPGYTPAEMAGICRVATRIKSVGRRREICALVGFGAGGGLGSADLRELRASHVIDRDGDGIVVNVPGPKPRRVTIRREFEDLVRIAIAGLESADLVIGVDMNRRNVANQIIEGAQIVEKIPPIHVARLRSTWISWLMVSNVPLKVLLEAAGLESARTLTDLLPTLVDVTGADAILRDGTVR